jgi:hypothetical protein
MNRLSMACLLLLLLTVPICGGCREPSGPLIINDFETDADLSALHWKCRTLLALSPDHATHGKRALNIGFYPSSYPGTSIKTMPRNWRRFDTLALEVYNPPSQGELRFAVRIDDRPDAPDFADRFNSGLILSPGSNHLRLDLHSLKTPSGRPLDLATIHALVFFLVDPPEKKELFMDYLRLE